MNIDHTVCFICRAIRLLHVMIILVHVDIKVLASGIRHELRAALLHTKIIKALLPQRIAPLQPKRSKSGLPIVLYTDASLDTLECLEPKSMQCPGLDSIIVRTAAGKLVTRATAPLAWTRRRSQVQ